MLFAEMQDGHDRRTEKLMTDLETSKEGFPDVDPSKQALLANFNLVGIRRRLNNIEIGVWVLVVLVACYVVRHW